MRSALGLIAALTLAAGPTAAQTPVLTVAVLKFGTVNWLTDTIQTCGFDAAEGFDLETLDLAGREASTIAFKSGAVDLIVADWIWAMRERAGGADVRFLPYSSALGALMVAADDPARTVCDLAGRTIGVVGGPQDKGWLIYNALAERDCGTDLRAGADVVFGAPPLMARQLETGDADAVSTYWHFAARLEADGARRLIDVRTALERLGVTPPPPLVGFVYDAGRTDPALVARLERAVASAGRLMLDSDAEWDRLRPLMQAEDDAAFGALREAYRDGVVRDGWRDADTAAARAVHAALIAAGGPDFAADAGPFDPAAFPR